MEENLQFDKKSLRYVTGKTADFGELAKYALPEGSFLSEGGRKEGEMSGQ